MAADPVVQAAERGRQRRDSLSPVAAYSMREIERKMFASRGGVTFVVTRPGHVLLEKCPNKGLIFGDAQWFVPGGKIEGDETPWEACKREFYEETGCTLCEAEALPIMDGAPEGSLFFPLHAFVVKNYSGTIPERATDSGVEFQWVPVNVALHSPRSQVRMMVAGALPYMHEALAEMCGFSPDGFTPENVL